MSDLAEFLRARIAEDRLNLIRLADPLEFVDDSYATRWGERVTAECEAKSSVLTLHGEGDAWCDHCDDLSTEPSDSCPTLRAIAAIYADHPDYREEWRA